MERIDEQFLLVVVVAAEIERGRGAGSSAWLDWARGDLISIKTRERPKDREYGKVRRTRVHIIDGQKGGCILK